VTCLICGGQAKHQKKFTDILFLKEEVDSVCSDCWSAFERIEGDYCPSCFKKGEASLCQDCQYWNSKGKEVSHQALFTYNEAIKEYFSKYKFQGDYLLRVVFSGPIKKALDVYTDYTIVPIPLSQESYKLRRFNQVIGFLEAAQISYQEILAVKKGKKRSSQSSKTRKERLETPQFFELVTSRLPEKVLLVDDIYTTGKTILLARELLHEKGVKKIKSFSLAH